MNYFYYDETVEYPLFPPYFPTEKYIEYPFKESDEEYWADYEIGAEDNRVYQAIRNLMIKNKMDDEHIGTKDWNPLGEYIQPEQTILIKPNMVKHFNSAEKDSKRGMDCLVTHPSVVRCLFDYVYIALRGKGKIIIADAPIQGCDFSALLSSTGYGALFEYVNQKRSKVLEVVTADLREVVYKRVDGIGHQEKQVNPVFSGVMVDLGQYSYFENSVDKNRLRITSYAGNDTVKQHKDGHNIYSISSAVLNADVIISVPKPTSHRIAGSTAALKNLIGANSRKEFLPHHKIGSIESGGDEYSNTHAVLKFINSKANDYLNLAMKHEHYKIEKMLDTIGRKTGKLLDKYEPNRNKFGMWYGNDTIWRTILDINHAVMYADKFGKIQQSSQRKMVYFGDMIVCGDHEGPLQPTYKKVGGILFSDNAVEFDRIVVRLMGFDYKKIPVLVHALEDEKLIEPEKEILGIKVCSNHSEYSKYVDDIDDVFSFVPTIGWFEHI